MLAVRSFSFGCQIKNCKQIKCKIMKLEITHLTPYFPYDLECMVSDYYNGYNGSNETKRAKLNAIWSDNSYSFFDLVESERGFEKIMPILRPLSDLNKELFMNGNFGFVPAKRLANEYLNTSYWGTNSIGTGILDKDGNMVNLCFIANEILGECPFMIYQSLCEWHFDIFNLIGQGLAVDINTLSGSQNDG